MISFDTFVKYLDTQLPLRPLNFSHIGDDGKQISQWGANLMIANKSEQCQQLEKVLTEMIVADISDTKRLELMKQLKEVTFRVVNQLRSDYIHEPSQLSKLQHGMVNQVASIYYLTALVFDGMMTRQMNQLQPAGKHANKRSWLTILPIGRSDNKACLQQIIYQLMYVYLNLMMEAAIIFTKPQQILWQQMNRLYMVAKSQGVLDMAYHDKQHNSHADSIHDIYKQACLYSLLRPVSFRRQDVLGIHKVLARWATLIDITDDPVSENKIYIDLNSNQPPECLTPYSRINPFTEGSTSLFVNLDKLHDYLTKAQSKEGKEHISFEMRLARLAQYTLEQQQYLQRGEKRIPTRRHATIVIGLHRIHYYLSNKMPLERLILADELPKGYHPKISRVADKQDYKHTLDATIMDMSKTGYRFSFGELDDIDVTDENEQMTQEYDKKSAIKQAVANSTALKILSIFALMPDKTDAESSWELGVIRWIENKERSIEAGARLMGYAITACGVRLESKDERSQDFVVALLVAGNESLGTQTSLILPQYHFKENDRVVLRIGDKQTNLRLAKNINNSDDMQQYEIVRLAG